MQMLRFTIFVFFYLHDLLFAIVHPVNSILVQGEGSSSRWQNTLCRCNILCKSFYIFRTLWRIDEKYFITSQHRGGLCRVSFATTNLGNTKTFLFVFLLRKIVFLQYLLLYVIEIFVSHSYSQLIKYRQNLSINHKNI